MMKMPHGNGDVSVYPADVGTSCQAWENDRWPGCHKGENPGKDNGWCAQQWCYVDPCKCSGLRVRPKPSMAMKTLNATYKGRPVYYSYATCGGTDTWSEEEKCEKLQKKEGCDSAGACIWGGDFCVTKELYSVTQSCLKPVPDAALGQSSCPCVGISGMQGNITSMLPMVLPADFGSKCDVWQPELEKDCENSTDKSGCLQKWCFVDPCQCDLPIPPTESSIQLTSHGKPTFLVHNMCPTRQAGSTCESQHHFLLCGSDSKRCLHWLWLPLGPGSHEMLAQRT